MNTEHTTPRGKFIVIEGGEGEGKSTLMRNLQLLLVDDPVVFTNAPRGTYWADQAQSIVFDELRPIHASAHHLLFWAALCDLMVHLIRPTLRSGKHVISDRFDSSTYTHQVCNAMTDPDGDFDRKLFELNRRVIFADEVPDLYIFLDISPAEGLARVEARGVINSYDKKSLEYHEKVYEGYLEFFATHPHRLVDARQSPDKVAEDVYRIVRECLA